MPKVTNANTYLSLNIGDIETTNAVTISFWYKYWGMVENAAADCLTIIRLNKEMNANLCLDKGSFNAEFHIKINNEAKMIFKESTISKKQGGWNLISIANFYSDKSISSYFDSMTNLFIFDSDTPRQKSYFIPNPGFAITSLDLGYELVSLYADIRIYKNYIMHPLGFLMNSNTKNNFLYKNFPLSGTSSTNCINISDTNESSLSVYCTEDFNEFLNTKNECKENNKYLDTSDPTALRCSNCHQICSSNCVGYNYKQCTCAYNERFSWLKLDYTTMNTYCESNYLI